jgi:hypothetical protein
VLQRDLHERIAIGAKTSSGLAAGLFVYGGDVKNILIIFDETLQQARELRCMRGVIDVNNPSGESEDLALAEKLFAEILFELESFAGERTSDFTLLNALGVLQLLFAQPDDLAMVEPQGSDADEQQGAQHNPKDAQASVRKLLESVR